MCTTTYAQLLTSAVLAEGHWGGQCECFCTSARTYKHHYSSISDNNSRTGQHYKDKKRKQKNNSILDEETQPPDLFFQG